VDISAVGYFFLNTWLWSMTWGFYHIPINIFVMLLLLKFVGKFSIIPSILMSFFSKVFSSALFTLIVVFLVFVIHLQLQVDMSNQSINVLLACICLGTVYAVFQMLFFVILNRFYTLNMRIVMLISVVSNVLSALLVYKFLDIS